jgi:CRP-like cAMP-binding protein
MSKAIWGLDQFGLFKGLNPNELQAVSQIVSKRSCRQGDIITDQSSKSREIYVLINGRVDIISLNGIPLYRISAGEAFGELAIVPGLKRTATAVCREDSVVLHLNMSHLETFGEEYPAVYRTITANIVTSLGVKLARANKLIELLKSELAKSLRKQAPPDSAGEPPRTELA